MSDGILSVGRQEKCIQIDSMDSIYRIRIDDFQHKEDVRILSNLMWEPCGFSFGDSGIYNMNFSNFKNTYGTYDSVI